MYYAYNASTVGWDNQKKTKLTERLSTELGLPLYNPYEQEVISKPHLRLDCFGEEGVYIRKITTMKPQDRKGLTKLADEIYRSVMNIQ